MTLVFILIENYNSKAYRMREINMDKNKNMNAHLQTEDVAVPEVCFDDCDELNNNKNVEETNNSSNIDYSGAIPEIHIKKNN